MQAEMPTLIPSLIPTLMPSLIPSLMLMPVATKRVWE
jgi:hypothetical protein